MAVDKKKYKKQGPTVSLLHQVASYLKPRTYKMFIVEMYYTYHNKSEHATQIITKHFKSMPESQQQKLLDLYDHVAMQYKPKRGAPKKR